MGYIKKLKNNELVGGTDKHTIYPVTSTEAVFEEATNGSESSFKSQKTINKEHQDILDDHEDRIQEAEVNDVKSITINGSTKKFVVDDENNVDLTVYTVDDDPEMPDIADKVDELRNMVGTSTPVLETSHKTRIETLEGGDSVTGSVENKIKTKVDTINSSFQDDNNEYVNYSMTQTSGKVTNFNIDETNLKNAITSLNSSISGDNIVIRSGSTPSGTGEPGKIYRYINSSANTYTDYMYSGGSWVALATHDTSNEQAQVAYYTCIATGSGAQATKQFVGNGSLTYTPSSGGHIKILMGEANTATGTIYLKFGTTSATDSTKKPLYYNGEPASASNTWEAGETIAVYYDETANSNAGAYFASNAQGGGGAGKREIITNLTGYYKINASTTSLPSVTPGTNYKRVVYPVNEGDVIGITGGMGADYCLWAIRNSNGNIIERSAINTVMDNISLVMPAGAATIVIQNNNNLKVAKWWYCKAGSAAAHEILQEGFLAYRIPQIALGTNYAFNDIVRTKENQRRKLTKDITPISISDTISVGDFKTNAGNTYKAVTGIAAYSSSTTYTDGMMALGTPSVAIITVTLPDPLVEGNISITIGENSSTIAVSTDMATTINNIMEGISAVTGWTFTAESNVITAKCNTGGANTLAFEFTDTENTGITIDKQDAVTGTSVISVYDASDDSWDAASIESIVLYIAGDENSDDVADTMTLDDIIYGATKQDSITEWVNDEFGDFTVLSRVPASTSVNTVSIVREDNDIIFSCTTPTSGHIVTTPIPATLTDNVKYIILFDYESTSINTTRIFFSKDNKGNTIGDNMYIPYGSGSFRKELTKNNNIIYWGIFSKNNMSANSQVKISNIRIYMADSYADVRSRFEDDEPVIAESKTKLDGLLTNYLNYGKCTNLPYTSTNMKVQFTENEDGLIFSVDTPMVGDYAYTPFPASLTVGKVYVWMFDYESTSTAATTLSVSSNYKGTTLTSVSVSIPAKGSGTIRKEFTAENNMNYLWLKSRSSTTINLSANSSVTLTNMFFCEKDSIVDIRARLAVYEGTSGSTDPIQSVYSLYDGKKLEIQQAKYNSSFNAIFFSDIHGDSTEMGRIRVLANKWKGWLTAVINGGDTIKENQGSPIAWYQTEVNKIDESVDVLAAIGNHDNMVNATDVGSGWVYDNIVGGDYLPTGVVQPENGAINKMCRYYKDYPEGNNPKIRVFVLDAMAGASNLWNANGEASTWFENALEDARQSNLAVLCITHAPYKFEVAPELGYGENYPLSDWYDNVRLFGEVGTTPNEMWYLPTSVMAKVKTFQDNGGVFICWLTGHVHRDLMGDVQNHTLYGYQPMISIGTARFDYRTGNHYGDVNTPEWRDLLNLICIDTGYSLLKIIRLGYNRSRTMRPRNILCYNYALHKIIWQE